VRVRRRRRLLHRMMPSGVRSLRGSGALPGRSVLDAGTSEGFCWTGVCVCGTLPWRRLGEIWGWGAAERFGFADLVTKGKLDGYVQ
jgi:hypothetical protein